MKRILALLIAALMLVSLTACNEKASVTTDTETAETAPVGGAVAPAQELTFEEVTVADNDDFSIKLTKIDPDDIFGYTVKASIENKTADKTLTFVCDKASINGIEVSTRTCNDLPAGKKSVEDVTFYDDILKKNGITDYTDIELRFTVNEEGNYDEYLFDEKVHVYPYGEEAAQKYEREALDTDVTVLDNEYVTVIYTGFERDETWDNVANFYVVNKSDKDLTLIAETVFVNDCDLDPIFAPTVSAGNVKFDYMGWTDDEFEENGIENVEKIEFEVYATDADDLYSEEYFRETVTLDLTK